MRRAVFDWFARDLKGFFSKTGGALALAAIDLWFPVLLRMATGVFVLFVLFFAASEMIWSLRELCRIVKHSREQENLRVCRDVHDS